MHAFILAGGFATRLWPLTEKRAKPLLPLAGVPLLTHLVEKIPAGIPITVSTNARFAEDFEEWKHSRHAERSEASQSEAERSRSTSQGSEESAPNSMRDASTPPLQGSAQHDVSILIEDSGHEDEKLGALGAVAKWIVEEKIDDDVLLLAGDNYMGFSIASFIERFTGKPLLAAYDIRSKEAAKKFGIVLTENSSNASGTIRVTGFQEKPAEPQSTLISTGCYLLPAESLQELMSFSQSHPDNIGGVFEHFLSEGTEVECVSFGEPWFDIGSFDAYLEATKVLVGERVLRGEKTLERDTEFHGSNVIGDNSKIARSTLTNVVLFEHCEVEDCVLENCIVDDGCILRGVDLSGKMLRAGTHLVQR
ncbi:MAG TPA: NDP-sugar synthase [Candidatus Peribacterales bacterium]|nr:NDP-sugar synthase [Candidatus Peribacterales bacterium]